MRLRVFQANDGDCLLLTSSDNRHMLIDGGRSGSYIEHVSKTVSALGELDVVCVSHIDADHITGILAMLESEVDWRIHLHEKANPPLGRKAKGEPAELRPSKIREIWHNGFGDQLGDSADDVSSMLSLAARTQLSFADADMLPRNLFLADLALGEKQAIELTHRIGADQLNIPLNKHFGGKLIIAGVELSKYQLGNINIQVIGPFKSDVTKLRKKWKKWVDKHKSAIKELEIEMEDDANRLGANEADTFLGNTHRIQSSAGQFGDRDSISAPNLASIMLLAEEAGGSVLLTGDGSSDDIEKGLKAQGKLDAKGRCHVDVLKVPHHGAAANVSTEFFKNVIADHYVFCGNGSHTNPEVEVINLIADARTGSVAKRSKHPNTANAFDLHFNCTPALAGTKKRKKHMDKLEARVTTLLGTSGGQMNATFYSASFFDIDI